MTVILILAAGSSSRMRGRDKLLEPVDGVPLLRLQARRALELGLPVYVAVPSADHPRVGALADLPVTVLAIPEAAEGMSGTLRGAMAALNSGQNVLLLLGDLAEIESGDLRAVANGPTIAPTARIWRGQTQDGKPGHPILFHSSLLGEFSALEGDSGGDPIVRRHRDETVLIALPGNRARRDLDTPEDWETFRLETGR